MGRRRASVSVALFKVDSSPEFGPFVSNTLGINEDLHVVFRLEDIKVNANDIPPEHRRVYSTESIFSALDFLDN